MAQEAEEQQAWLGATEKTDRILIVPQGMLL